MERKKYPSRTPSRCTRAMTIVSFGCIFFRVLFLSWTSFGAGESNIANIDSDLQHLVKQAHNAPPNPAGSSLAGPQPSRAPAAKADNARFSCRFDEQGRVLVHVYLDGTQTMQALERALTS